MNIERYTYNANVGRYRDTITGRFVSQDVISDTLQTQIEATVNRLQGYFTLALDPDEAFTLTNFRDAFVAELRTLHVQLAVVAAGGRDRATQADYGRTGQLLRQEYAYLNNFMAEVGNGELTERDARRRVGMYFDKAWATYGIVKRTKMQEQGFTEERRIRRSTESCDDCIRLEALSWQPIGTLPVPADGNTACLSNCKCDMVYR